MITPHFDGMAPPTREKHMSNISGSLINLPDTDKCLVQIPQALHKHLANAITFHLFITLHYLLQVNNPSDVVELRNCEYNSDTVPDLSCMVIFISQ